MSFKWENNSVTIVLLPNESRYKQVHEQLKQWIADGLLGNFIWMTADDIQPQTFGPPKLSGLIWGLDVNRELKAISVDPFEEMAKNRFKTVRLMAVRVLSNTFDNDQNEFQKFNLLSEYIRLSLPMAISADRPGEKTDLRRINLIVYPTDLQKTDQSAVFQGHWDHHVIASPEDRKTPLSADRFVREDSRFPKFIAMHIAATGGLWNGIAKSPFDEMQKPESGHRTFQLSRIFVSTVLTDGLSRRVAASVLSDLANPDIDLFKKGLPAEIEGTYFIPEESRLDWVESMVDVVFERDNRILSFIEPEDSGELRQVRWTEWSGIKDFFIFSAKKIISIPKWIWIWLRRRIGRKLTESLTGNDGGIIIGVDQDDAADLRDKQLFDAFLAIQENIAHAKKALVTPDKRVPTVSKPSLWSDIRELVYGFLEGSDKLENFGYKAENNRWPIFSKVSDVIQDPKKTIEVPSNLSDCSSVKSINWDTIDQADELLNAHQNHIAELKSELDQILDQIVSLGSEIENLSDETPIVLSENATEIKVSEFEASQNENTISNIEIPIGEDSSINSEEKPDNGTESAYQENLDEATKELASDKRSEYESKQQSLKLKAEELSNLISEKESSANQFAEIIESNRNSFLWRVFSRMKMQKQAAVDRSNEYEAAVTNIELPEPGELVRLRKRFHKTISGNLGGALLIWAIWWLITRKIKFAWILKFAISDAQIIRYLVSYYFVVLFSALVLYYRDWRRFDWRVRKLNHKMKQVADGVDHVRSENRKLNSLYAQVKDWLEIIGTSVNRPWSMNEKWFASFTGDPDQNEFPLSFRVAIAQEQDPSSMRALQGLAVKKYMVRGWRTGVLAAQVQAIADTLGLPTERMNLHKIDSDINYSPGGPRNELKAGLGNQQAMELVGRRQLVPLAYKIQSTEITKARPAIKENRTNQLDEIQIDYSGLAENETLVWDKFLEEPIGPFEVTTPFSIQSLNNNKIGSGYHEKLTSNFVVPKRLESLAMSNENARVDSYQEGANMPMDIVIRMDLSDSMPPEAIKLFGSSMESDLSMSSKDVVRKVEDEEIDEDDQD